MAPQHQIYSYVYKRSTNTFNDQNLRSPAKQNNVSILSSVHRQNMSSILENHGNNVTTHIGNSTNSTLEFAERERTSSLPPSLSIWLTHIL